MTDPLILSAAILAFVWLWRLLRPVRVVGEWEAMAKRNTERRKGWKLR